jgi:hypothetical protein
MEMGEDSTTAHAVGARAAGPTGSGVVKVVEQEVDTNRVSTMLLHAVRMRNIFRGDARATRCARSRFRDVLPHPRERALGDNVSDGVI